MLQLYFKLALSPVVYTYLVLRSFIKYLIIVPFLSIIYFIKNAFVWVIISIVAAFFITPIGTAVIIIIALIVTFSSTKDDVVDAIPNCFCGGWNYYTETLESIKKYKEEKQRIKQEQRIIKLYDKVADEFIGFDQIADIFVSLK